MTNLVLLSGGLDSSTLLAFEKRQFQPVEHAVFVDYGQRHVRERRSAEMVAAHYGVTLHSLDLTSYGRNVRSALTSDDVAVPHGHYAADNMAITVVPNRNAVMLSAAAGVASSLGLARVVTAVHSGDHAVYPDCRPEFIDALAVATRLACGVDVAAPFVNLSKTDIAKLAGQMELPIELTWSCYEGKVVHCGRCGTCVERAEAIHDAGVHDPTTYEDPYFWRTQVGA